MQIYLKQGELYSGTEKIYPKSGDHVYDGCRSLFKHWRHRGNYIVVFFVK